MHEKYTNSPRRTFVTRCNCFEHNASKSHGFCSTRALLLGKLVRDVRRALMTTHTHSTTKMWFGVGVALLGVCSSVEATLVRTDICNNDAIFAVDTDVIATSYDDVLDQISEQFLFKSFDIPVNGNNLSRAYRGHFATVATRDEQTCLTDGFLGLITTYGDLGISVSGRMNGADDFVYDCGGCPEQDQLIQADYLDESMGVFGVEEFLWLFDSGRLREEIELFPGGTNNRNSDTLYLFKGLEVYHDRAFVIEYTPVCVDFNAWAAENVANSADRRCDTARSDNGTSFSFKGENCSLLCEEPYVMTSGPPDYNTVVSDTFTCTHDTEPEWEGEATCTQLCRDFSSWVVPLTNEWPNIDVSNVHCTEIIPGTICSVPCNPDFEADGGTDLMFICDPENAPLWTVVDDSTRCTRNTDAASTSPPDNTTTEEENKGSCTRIHVAGSLNPDQNECADPVDGDICFLECSKDMFPTAGNAYFVCKGNEWLPANVEPLRCSSLCPELDLSSHNYSQNSRWASRLPGSEFTLSCATGYTPEPDSPSTLVCSDSGRWSWRGSDTHVDEDNLMKCEPQTCLTTIGIEINFFPCDFNETQTVYETYVAFGYGHEMIVRNGTKMDRIALIPGRNEYNTTKDGNTYTFVTFMEAPSNESHLEELNFINFNAADSFEPNKLTYSFEINFALDSLIFDTKPAEFGSVSTSLSQEGENENMSPEYESPFKFSIPVSISSFELSIVVTAQDNSSSTYTVEFNRLDVTSCPEQTLCEYNNMADCGSFCNSAGERPNEIEWVLPLALSGGFFVLWLITVFAVRRLLPIYGWFSSETITFYSSLLDLSNDVVFIMALLQTKEILLTWLAVGFIGCTLFTNAFAVIYVVRCEMSSNPKFREWLSQYHAFAAVVSFFSLANCESFVVICIGFVSYQDNPRILKRSSTNPSEETTDLRLDLGGTETNARFLAAPLSSASIRVLRYTSCVGLVVGDIGLFGIQLQTYLRGNGIFQNSDIVLIFVALKLMMLALRMVIFGCRTYVLRAAVSADTEVTTAVIVGLQQDIRKSLAVRSFESGTELAEHVKQTRGEAASASGLLFADPTNEPAEVKSQEREREHDATDEAANHPEGGAAVFKHLIKTFARAKADTDAAFMEYIDQRGKQEPPLQ